jgi:hypothetical protein
VEEGTVMKGGRFAFWNDQFYFKTQAEMGSLFRTCPIPGQYDGNCGQMRAPETQKRHPAAQFRHPAEFARPRTITCAT